MNAKRLLLAVGIIFSLIILFLFTNRFFKRLFENQTLPINSRDLKPMSFHTNIIKDTQENQNFRRVMFTGSNSQLVIMTIPPGGEVGKETHKYTEQTLFFLSGTGEGEFDGKKFPIGPGDVAVVVPGTEHNFRNTGTQDLKIYTVYSPPNHIDGRIHKTKSDADADIADEAIGETKPSYIK